MKLLGYSELTKRIYILPTSAKKLKIDITEDVNEFIKFKTGDRIKKLAKKCDELRAQTKADNETIEMLRDRFTRFEEPLKSRVTELQSTIEEKEKELEYWKQLAESADKLLSTVPLNNGNWYLVGFDEYLIKWQELKQQKSIK